MSTNEPYERPALPPAQRDGAPASVRPLSTEEAKLRLLMASPQLPGLGPIGFIAKRPLSAAAIAVAMGAILGRSRGIRKTLIRTAMAAAVLLLRKK